MGKIHKNENDSVTRRKVHLSATQRQFAITSRTVTLTLKLFLIKTPRPPKGRPLSIPFCILSHIAHSGVGVR